MVGEKDLELCKQRFQNSLAGKWITAEGTFFQMSEIFEFYEDGTGIWIESSGLGDCKTYFEWKIERPFVLKIRETRIEDGSTSGEEFEEESSAWSEFEYEFNIVSNDCGNEIVLCNKGSDHFYYSTGRIGYSGVV